ncbi:N-6 DNA methylase [Bosea sp. LC85]|uniref:class I SAM-dependent DNA methyltransferase n=1 Tax=Bosea sp. LC85 TaxID=1502851 RepID=UPI0004E3D8CB|nr:N-6 DNA methylase [Bosea sp. LC85]KFC65276.1 N-6 DNA methylase [Bosea sp. LC85]
MAIQDNIVQRIWNLCHILRGDGVSYHEYISELTYLLFLRIAAANKSEELIPKGYRWKDIVGYDGEDLLTHYRDVLTFLGGHAEDERVRKIYAFPTTVFSHSENLRAVIDGIDRLDWSSISTDAMGDIYEGLIAKNSQDARSGAGQYFTPRALVDSIVRLVAPRGGELIQDPAAGSGGFLIAAHDYMRRHANDSKEGLGSARFEGMEIEKGTFRICLMNAFLHGLDLKLILGDALTADSADLAAPDVILANPPFGARSGGARKQRDDLSYPTGNKQLAFLQHIYLGLKPGGRAAVVLPDNALFEEGMGRKIREDLLDRCDLHTIVRLPTGIFYAQNVMTNVLFFVRGAAERDNTKNVWIYDLRANMAAFGRKQPLSSSHLADFEACFGNDPFGKALRTDQGERGRFRCFTREQIAERNDNLDIAWLRDDSNFQVTREPEELVAAIAQYLRNALEHVDLLAEQLEARGANRE